MQPFLLCNIQSGVGRYEVIQMVCIDDTYFTESWASKLCMAAVHSRNCWLVRVSHVEK
jgi:hypothetical protein